MSQLEAALPPTTDPTPAANRRRSPLTWMVAGCALFVASGLVRVVQDRQHQAEASITEACPFPLKSIPTTLGGWKVVEGGERTLDPLTMRITGGSDHIMRTYVDELTGVSLVVLVLFGPAAPVTPHTPEICYPSSGFAPAGDAADRDIASEGAGKFRFRSAIYAKNNGLTPLREGVYHSFRLGGNWSPDVGSGRKFPRRNPGVFKVQVQRRVAAGERLDRDDPIEQFLKLLIPEIERKIEATTGPAESSKSGPVAPAGRGDRGVGPDRASTPGPGGDGHLPGWGFGLADRGSHDRAGQDGKASDDQDREDHRGKIEDQGNLECDATRPIPTATGLARRRATDHRTDSSNSNSSIDWGRPFDRVGRVVTYYNVESRVLSA